MVTWLSVDNTDYAIMIGGDNLSLVHFAFKKEGEVIAEETIPAKAADLIVEAIKLIERGRNPSR